MDQGEFKVVTIGAYGHTEQSFRSALITAGVTLLCDIRARRGMRGREMAWANSLRLQKTLKEAGILYYHCKDLAPSVALRAVQRSDDEDLGSTKRQRMQLSPQFIDGYRSSVLDSFCAKDFFAGLPIKGGMVAFFCVESVAAACHRGLLAEKLAHETNVIITHI